VGSLSDERVEVCLHGLSGFNRFSCPAQDNPRRLADAPLRRERGATTPSLRRELPQDSIYGWQSA
jgi:hypothetical protein